MKCTQANLTQSWLQAMASIARAMIAVLTAGELEERLRSVEALMMKAGTDDAP